MFFMTGILNAIGDSLFTYLPYESFESVRDPEFRPTFVIDRDSADVSICNGDPFCEYDVVITGDQGVGMATLAAVANIQKAVELSYPGTCVFVSSVWVLIVRFYVKVSHHNPNSPIHVHSCVTTITIEESL